MDGLWLSTKLHDITFQKTVIFIDIALSTSNLRNDVSILRVSLHVRYTGFLVLHCSNIEELALFPGQKPARLLSYGNKQLISREVELEKMRRTEARLQTDTDAPKETSCSNTTLPNHRQTLQPKTISAEMVSVI